MVDIYDVIIIVIVYYLFNYCILLYNLCKYTTLNEDVYVRYG